MVRLEYFFDSVMNFFFFFLLPLKTTMWVDLSWSLTKLFENIFFFLFTIMHVITKRILIIISFAGYSAMQKEVLNMGFASLCQPENLTTPLAHELLFLTNLHHIRFVTHWHACCASPCWVLIARHISSIIIIILEWPTHKVSHFKLH